CCTLLSLSCTIRLNNKAARTWFVEFVFCNCPVPSACPKEQGPCRALHYAYDFSAGTQKQMSEMVDEMLNDWCIIGHLYKVVLHNSFLVQINFLCGILV
ncbi:mediator of RNA polymerase II transcription subunit 14, partial [Caerostris extrusa]